MSAHWVVQLDASHGRFAYGPFDDEAQAEHFADFLTAAVDPAKVLPLRSATAELLAFVYRDRDRIKQRAERRPAEWPPSPGDVWEDRNGDRWICTRLKPGDTSGYLTCIARQADDSAEEIWRLYGPLTYITHLDPHHEEVPF